MKKKRKKTPEELLAYYRKKYRERKKRDKDYGKKDYLKVRVWECKLLTRDQVRKYPRQLRVKLHRYCYIAQAGSIKIPEEYLGTDRDMAEYVANIVGGGEWLIKAGYAHKNSKRVVWRTLIRFEARELENGEIKVNWIKSKPERLRHYWFRKKKKN